MKYVVSLIALSAVLMVSGAEHRFYAIEAGGDSIAEGIEYSITIDSADRVEIVTLHLRNTRRTPFQPIKAGIKLGVDTYMDKYPDWYDKFFPTLAVYAVARRQGKSRSVGRPYSIVESRLQPRLSGSGSALVLRPSHRVSQPRYALPRSSARTSSLPMAT